MHIVLGEHLDVKTFACLVRVCRDFRDIFTPMLYAQWYSELILDGPRKPDMPPLPFNISLAKEVEIRIDGEFRDWDEADFEEDPEDEEVQLYREERIIQLRKACTDHMTRIVELGAGVQTLKLIDSANDDILFHAFTEEGFRKALQACTKLKKLQMKGCFQNLSFLELHDFNGGINGVEDIARLFSRCPHLKVLILGPTDYGSSFEPYYSNGRLRQDSKYVLEHLCDFFKITKPPRSWVFDLIQQAMACDHSSHQRLVLGTSEIHGFHLRFPLKAASIVKAYGSSFFRLNDA
ncbi:hypothetical protein BHYA_0033g00080 [Botrytis hyacinthi]|uniref:F-box domain-containing protein n=1 Tax=Botrytis hyacinthi TaxID=278943 RepID=A0A4Z1GV95_9HELO|nr:hypothetical protein BHYA_0033g00080 [Botrytis hyacinthi]